jgi:hypothetical protein
MSGPYVETSVTSQWLNSVVLGGALVEEHALVFRAGSESLSIKSKDIPIDQRFWIPLLQSGLAVLRPVFRQSLQWRNFHCIRVDLQAVSDYSVKYLRSESVFSNVLSHCYAIVEGPATMHAKYSIFGSKKRHIEEVPDAVPIAFGGHVDLINNTVSERLPRVHTLDPIHIVSAHPSSAWHSSVLTLAGLVPTLVITSNPGAWKQTPMSLLGHAKLSRAQLKDHLLFVVDVQDVPSIMLDQEKEFDIFSKIIGSTVNAEPNRTQIQRFLWNKFTQSYPHAKISVANMTWPCVIEHDVDDVLPFRGTEKHIVVLHHSNLRASWPSWKFVAECYATSEYMVRATFPVWSQYVTALDVSRTLLRNIKVRVVPVKQTLAEQRAESLHLPRSFLLRLTPAVFPPEQAKLVFKIPSMAQYNSSVALFTGSESFLHQQIDKESPCCICFDSCTERTVSLCGHTFCKDCSITVFQDAVRNPAAIVQCPYCRNDLSCGDFVTVSSSAKPVVAKRSKEAHLGNALVIDELGELGETRFSPEVCPLKASLVIVSLRDVTAFVTALLSWKCVVKIVCLQSHQDLWVKELQELLQ